MKKILAFLLVALFSLESYAQEISRDKVPPVITVAFKQKFPKASDISWEMKGEQFNVDFEIDRRDHEAWYDGSGKLLKHTRDIRQNELPKAVLDAIRKQFVNYRVSDTEKTTDHQGADTYKVELKKLSSDLDVIFSPEGKVLDQKAD